MKKRIPRRGYKMLAVIWTLAAASIAVAVVRWLPLVRLSWLCLMAASAAAAAGFWKTYKRTPEGDGLNNDSEEKKHE